MSTGKNMPITGGRSLNGSNFIRATLWSLMVCGGGTKPTDGDTA
jgi:hypothetical protein